MMASNFKKTSAAYNNAAPVKSVRRLRRAYLGLHGLAFDFAVKRAKKRYGQFLDLTDSLVDKGEVVEAEAADRFNAAKDKAVEMVPAKVMKAAQRSKVKMTTERTVVKTTPDAKPVAKAAAKTTTKKTAAKKPVAQKTAAKKAAAKSVAKVKVPAKNTKVVEKAATVIAADVADKYEAYVADVLRYDAKADAATVKKIVDHLGIALNSRDGKFVACTDETERNTVRDSFLKKKLGLESVDADLDARVLTICDLMKADRFKNRVTFYYLLAKEDGKLASL
ncbi:DUF2853 family protein [Litorimonas sp. RW-G-Af-16]|uniref:DUF2853 family protein n=1 Tax=Litorimonas sp. RW-G-Af-16 TaxID=3241168 RepID=UPI00390CBE14